MVDVDKAVIARIKKEGDTFEVLVDCDNAIAFKEGKDIDMKDILAAEEVFSDASKGLKASEKTLLSIFDSDAATEVAKTIISEGEIQLTSEYRKKLKENKKIKIIQAIVQNGVDPKTHLPHPAARIEAAMDEAKAHIDEFRSVNKQVEEVLKKIKTVLPIKFEVKEVALKVPSTCAAKSYNIVTSFGKILKDEWLNDGSWAIVLEIPGGLEQDLYDKMNSLCQGEIETKVLKTR